jgi:hypothetical protein
LLLFVNYFLAGFHDRVALLLAATIVSRASGWSAAT